MMTEEAHRNHLWVCCVRFMSYWWQHRKKRQNQIHRVETIQGYIVFILCDYRWQYQKRRQNLKKLNGTQRHGTIPHKN